MERFSSPLNYSSVKYILTFFYLLPAGCPITFDRTVQTFSHQNKFKVFFNKKYASE